MVVRKLIIIPLLLICLNVFGDKFYVSPTGNDAAAGTIGAPWRTWGKAFNDSAVDPGDTVYFRGGIYLKNLSDGNDNWYYPARSANGTGYTIANTGTSGNLVYYLAYPGETPVLDCQNVVPPVGASTHQAIRASPNYCYFKGLTIRNVRQTSSAIRDVNGVLLNGGNYTWENCTMHNIGGGGFYSQNATNVNYINCDSYLLCDTLGDLGAAPGNDGTGFRESSSSASNSIHYRGCRAWLCGDNGFSSGSEGTTTYDSCWAFNNGLLQGLGHGFKMGWTQPDAVDKRIIATCISAFNDYAGFNTNDNDYANGYLYFYNNTSYKNGRGFMLFDTPADAAIELHRYLRNNIAYLNTTNIAGTGSYTHDHNSWDTPGVSVSAADFISLDSTGLTGARTALGYLPTLNFLKLAESSEMIDAGTNLGYGDDIGAYQYSDFVTPVGPIILTTTQPYWLNEFEARSGGNVIDDGGATVTQKGVTWNTTGTPVIGVDSYTEDGTGLGAFVSNLVGLTKGETYYVRAYATNSEGTEYGNQYLFRESQLLISPVTGRPLIRRANGKVLHIRP